MELDNLNNNGKIYVISVGRNANLNIIKCLESVQKQSIKPEMHIVVDDTSSDDTSFYLENYNKQNVLVKKIYNKNRNYRLKNIYDNSIIFNDNDIIFILDNDDWFPHENVIDIVLKEYEKNPKLKFIYSNYQTSNGQNGNNKDIPNNQWNPYSSAWQTSHLCTYKAGLLKKVPLKNFLDQNNKWFEIGTDQAMILPMLQILKNIEGNYSSVKFINSVLYIYNRDYNPSKDINSEEQKASSILSVNNVNYIRKRGFINE